MHNVVNPVHKAVRVVENRLGIGYSRVVENPLYEAIFVYVGDTPEGFQNKKKWLRDTYGLVHANPEADAVGELQKKVPGALEDILVFEDERVPDRYKGTWRVRCNLKGDESSFYFRQWEKGDPAKIGEDTMAGTMRDFQREFQPSAVYQFGRNYQIEIDWDKAEKLSPHPITSRPLKE